MFFGRRPASNRDLMAATRLILTAKARKAWKMTGAVVETMVSRYFEARRSMPRCSSLHCGNLYDIGTKYRG